MHTETAKGVIAKRGLRTEKESLLFIIRRGRAEKTKKETQEHKQESMSHFSSQENTNNNKKSSQPSD